MNPKEGLGVQLGREETLKKVTKVVQTHESSRHN
jgi:hypothetical protein